MNKTTLGFCTQTKSTQGVSLVGLIAESNRPRQKSRNRNSATLSVEKLPDALTGLGDWPFNWLCARILPQLGRITPHLVAQYHHHIQSNSLQI
ncbi:hypothetical protein EV14_2212 [Prochlorococcus sp. MIT 0703]|nr:hypothetical protein EV12_0232 [Prochlorococcus sp. MIT 0701]KGG31482.1 hypothetical protein EV14_2212 [Prochlorococcus sp. MIT 0703]